MTDQTVTLAAMPAGSKPPKKVKARVAEHELLDINGDSLEDSDTDMELAHSYQYALKGYTGAPFVWSYADATEDEKRMLSLFAAKTLSTNETSQKRNDPKGAASPDEQMDALRQRFAGIRTGQWMNREREGGPKVDKAKLAEAVIDVQILLGKVQQADRDSAIVAKLDQLEKDPAYMRIARQVPQVADRYGQLIGRSLPTADQL